MLNLPAHAKLGEPGYRDFAPAEIPQLTLPCGSVQSHRRHAEGRRHRAAGRRAASGYRAAAFDLHLPAGSGISPQVPEGHRLLLYVYEGALRLGEHTLGKGQLVRLSEHGEVRLHSESGTRLLLLAGRPRASPSCSTAPS